MIKNYSASAAVRRVKELAEKEGISVEELLARSAIDRSTFWRWKKKKTKPDPRLLIVIESVCKNIKR